MSAFKINLKQYDTDQYQLELDGRNILVFTESDMKELIKQYNELNNT